VDGKQDLDFANDIGYKCRQMQSKE